MNHDNSRGMMGYITAGINHKTAPIALREQVVFSAEQLPDALKSARKYLDSEEVAILSTCNRTELYCSNYKMKASSQCIIKWLTHYHQADNNLLSRHSYTYQDKDAVQHIMRVACGLDSLVLGEPQILGQLKSAYSIAQKAGTAGSGLNRLFQYSFTTAKQIRTETAINKQPISIAYAATRLAQQIFTDLKKSTALLIGAGETIELVTRHLHQQGLCNFIIANRSIEKSKRLTDIYGGHSILLTDLGHTLHNCDIVISSTASPVPVLGKGLIERALRQRKRKPVFMIDLAVPRDIEPEASELADVFLYSVDDLHDVIEDNLHQRKKAAIQAENMIRSDVLQFMDCLRSLDCVELLRKYRDRTENIRDQELKKAQHLLARGADPKEILQQFARSLTNKLMHEPSIQMKSAATRGEPELLTWAAKLLGLTEKKTLDP